MTAPAWKCRPATKPSGDFQGVPTPATSVPDRAIRQPHIGHPDSNHRRPPVGAGGHHQAAVWAQFEKAATELLEGWQVAQYSRSADIHERWALRYAELNDPEQARECHTISSALHQRAELIRRYPGEFTDTLAVLADIFHERQEFPGGAHVRMAA